ncbi:TonB-dependent receptor [Arcobacter arenosus]|uniref:TonB-dependent receptor n=1 Tax=Arcobacter arenosus TaxID=2576037 RepID=A0A5R8XXX4_9BACT|nr:TonB-dependent receptor [Arcobacter arenosus]TLP36274.1 TonB-dependent receptor [Arcobacter arenosus]
MPKIKKSISLVTSLILVNSLNAVELESINVVSSTIDDKYEEKLNSTSNTFIIDNEEIEKMDPTNVEDILNTIPGITASNVGNDRVKIHIRGIDNQMYMGERPGVAIVIDGVPVQETTGKINLDLDNIESIKVIKGSASYLYGNDAIGGALVITTKRPKGISTSKFETEVGSFGFKRALLGTNQSFDNSSLQLQASYRDTDGYWHDAYLNHKSINGKYQYYLNDNSDLTFGLDYTKRKSGDGTSVHGIDAVINDPKSVNEVSYAGFYDTSLIKTFLTYSNDIDDTSNFMAVISRYQDDTTSRSSRDSTDTFHLKNNDEKWIQNTFKSEYRKSFGNIAAMIGVNLEKNSQDNESVQRVTYGSPWTGITTAGTLLSDNNTDENISAIYLELQYKITPKLNIVGNYRYDYISYDYKNNMDSSLNVDPSYNNSSFKLGLNYELDENNYLYTSYSTGFRAPTAGQISGNLSLLQSNPALDIPTELDPEKTQNFEVGIKGTFKNINYDLSAYQLDRIDYIGKKAGSYIWSTDDDEYLAVDNVGDMRSRGIELAINSKINDSFSYNLAYTFLDAKLIDYSVNPNDGNPEIELDGNYVPRTSRHTLNFGLDWNVNQKFVLSPEVVAKSSYYADEANLYKQPGYAVINLRGNYKITDSLEVFGKITNLLDKNYYQFVNVSYGSDMTDATIRVAHPRAFYAGLRYKF